MLKKLFLVATSILVASSVNFLGLSMAVSAEDLTGELTVNESYDSQLEPYFISVEDFENMVWQNASARVADEAVYVSKYREFIPYAQTDFSQERGCGPTAVANLLSYFQGTRNVRLFDGDIITQSIYNQICTDVKWNTTGSNMINVSNGLKTFCKRAGKTCDIDTYLLNLWSDVTRDIKANKPILLNAKDADHFMVVFGYRVYNGEQYLYVCTGLEDAQTSMFGYFKWGQDSIHMRSVNIY